MDFMVQNKTVTTFVSILHCSLHLYFIHMYTQSMKYITKLVSYKILGYIRYIIYFTISMFHMRFILVMSISLMPLFYEIMKLDE